MKRRRDLRAEAQLRRERRLEATEIEMDGDLWEAAGFYGVLWGWAEVLRGHVVLRKHRNGTYAIPEWIHVLLGDLGAARRSHLENSADGKRILGFIRYWCRHDEREPALRAITVSHGPRAAVEYAIENYPFPVPRVILEAQSEARIDEALP